MAFNAANVKLDTKRLDQIAAQLDTNAEGVLDALAFRVDGGAKLRAPVDTGALKNSIHVERVRRLVRRISDAVEYGIFQELGTYKMAAQPFMVPAVEAVRRDLARMYSQGLIK